MAFCLTVRHAERGTADPSALPKANPDWQRLPSDLYANKKLQFIAKTFPESSFGYRVTGDPAVISYISLWGRTANMPTNTLDKPSVIIEGVSKRETVGKVHSPIASPRQDSISPSLSLTKESLDNDRHASSRASGSPRASLVDDRGVDPLSLHILKRTGTEAQLKYRPSGPNPGEEGQRSRQGSLSNHPEATPTESAAAVGVKTIANAGRNILGEVLGNESGHKKKGSLLTRIMGGKDSDESDDESAENLKRTEGLDAQAFSAPLGVGAAAAPPKYIRVRSHNKVKKDFDHLFLAQELYNPANAHPPSKPGTASKPTTASSKNGHSLLTPSDVPNTLPRHKTGAIWSMKFSRDGKYLAAGGQDMIVRVWSIISTPEERKKHESLEEAVGIGDGTEYHQGRGLKLNAPVFLSEPLHEYVGHTADVLDLSWSKNNFLLSSSMDKTVRLWHATKKECLCCFQHSDFVTAIAFHPRDDRFFLSGSLDCKLRLWSIPDKQVAFWNELPELITAVAFTPDGKFAIAGSFVGLCLFYETDGLRYHTQIHVRSTRGRNSKGSKITGIKAVSIPTGSSHGEVKLLITSNDSRVRMYNFRDKSLEVKFKGNMNTCSQIHATFNDTGKFVVCGSEDRKVYIWNGSAENNSKRDKRGYEYFEAHSTIVTVAIFAPTQSRQSLAGSGDPVYELCKGHQGLGLAPTASTTSVASQMSTAQPSTFHADGNIIVTADYTGQIKVFRQDCAWAYRKLDGSDSASIRNRAKSSLARGSSSSIRPSGFANWRNSTTASRSGSTHSSSRRNSVSSLTAPTNTTQTALAGKNLDVPKAGTVTRPNGRGTSPSPTRGPGLLAPRGRAQVQQDNSPLRSTSSDSMTRKKSTAQDRLMLQEDGQSMAFYSLSGQRRDTTYTDRSASVSPIPGRRGSVSSGHSLDSVEEAKSFVDAEERLSNDNDMVCRNCAARTFNAFKVQNGPHKGETKLRCSVYDLVRLR